MKNKRRILVTMALPYANGSIHLGHLVGYITADIWSRFQRMHGHECYYVCGDDAHGTPIMLTAEKKNLSPEALIQTVQQEHESDLAGFHICFDHYYTTHSKENRELAETIYHRLKQRGDIITKVISQAYDPEKNMFLPDRYVKGECPRCHATDQYGDNCESCGATYTPAELINPVSVISGATPINKESEHLFLDLHHYTDHLKKWTTHGHLQDQMTNKLDEWFSAGLKPWNISRDAPYFGFEIPDMPGKYFYVWMDAPIGYMASFKKFCESSKLNFDDFWGKESTTELHQFIGKDIIYFHSLFWPAMLHGAGFRMPTAIYANGFLTINGKKMSKSRGTFINARTYLDHLNPEYLRYYLAAKLGSGVDDLDLNLDDFVLRVNADLVGKIVNIASRCAGFINKKFEGMLSSEYEPTLYATFKDAGIKIAKLYGEREFNQVVRLISQLADTANQYIDHQKPWIMAKTEGQDAQVQFVCTMGINLFRLIMIYLKPILPAMAENVEAFLSIPPMMWDDCETPLLAKKINSFKPLITRIDPAQITALQQAANSEYEA